MNSAVEPPRRPRHRSTYFWLASIQFVAVLCVVYFGNHLISGFADAVRYDRSWAELSEQLSQMQDTTDAVGAPGNNVFISNDVDYERGRLIRVAESLHHQLDGLGVRLRASAAVKEDERKFDDRMILMREGLGSMVDVSNRVFDAIVKSEMHQASAHMAILNRHHRASIDAVSDIRAEISAARAKFIDDELRFAAVVERYGSIAAACAVLSTLALSW